MKSKLSLLLFLILAVYGTASAQQKTNVLFILADDLGIGDVGVYGQQKIETPHIDALARQGMLFTQFYAGTSVCAPSRASLITGLHTGHTAVRGNFEIKPEGQLPLPDSCYTLGKLFKNAGYATGAFGKWGLGMVATTGDPNIQGFDTFYGYNCQRQSHNYFPDHLWNNTQRVDLENTLEHQEIYSAALIQAQALQFIEAHQAQPFFAYMAYTLPHAALQLPQDDKYFEYYKNKFNEQPKNINLKWDGVNYQPQRYPHAAYAAMVARMDEYIGQLVAKLKQLGIYNQTLIVFTSDNGAHREGGNEPEFFNSNGGYRGIKRMLYEGGIRVPMIVSWPGKVKPGLKNDFVGAFWDFMPTFAALTGQKLTHATDGISFLPTILKQGKQAEHNHLYWEFHEDGGRQAIRFKDWKAVKNNINVDKNAAWELYNLKSDVHEQHNLASKYPKIIAKITQLAKESRTPSFKADWNLKDWKN